MDYFILFITIIILLIPEGLPLSTTLTLAHSLDSMKDKGCLVKKKEGFEYLAGIDILLTDKTSI